jgi:hypothetical protein
MTPSIRALTQEQHQNARHAATGTPRVRCGQLNDLTRPETRAKKRTRNPSGKVEISRTPVAWRMRAESLLRSNRNCPHFRRGRPTLRGEIDRGTVGRRVLIGSLRRLWVEGDWAALAHGTSLRIDVRACVYFRCSHVVSVIPQPVNTSRSWATHGRLPNASAASSVLSYGGEVLRMPLIPVEAAA